MAFTLQNGAIDIAGQIAHIAPEGIGLYSARLIGRDGDSSFAFEVVLDGLNNPTGAVSTDDCERFSASLAEWIDNSLADAVGRSTLPVGLSAENYTLEVSSAGAERRLRLPSELERFKGQPLKIRFRKDGKDFIELATYHSVSGAGDDRIYQFLQYVPMRKRGKKKTKGAGQPNLEMGIRHADLIQANLYLDF